MSAGLQAVLFIMKHLFVALLLAAAAITMTGCGKSTSDDAPKFKSAKVNAFVKDYAAFVDELVADRKDPVKAQDPALLPKAVELVRRGLEIEKELENDPEELQKYHDYATKLSEKLQ